MRPAALLYLAVLAAAASAWAVVVLPRERESAALSARLAGEDLRGRIDGASDPRPTAGEALRLEEAVLALRPGPATPAPAGMAEEKPGTFAGRLPWSAVQGLLGWAAEQPAPVLEIDVRAVPEDPARAACRVVFGK